MWNQAAGYKRPEIHFLPEDTDAMQKSVALLDQVIAPCAGPSLVVAVRRFLAGYPYGLFGDEARQRDAASQWVSAMEPYPGWAVGEAFRWMRDRDTEKAPIISKAVGKCDELVREHKRLRGELVEIYAAGRYFDSREEYDQFCKERDDRVARRNEEMLAAAKKKQAEAEEEAKKRREERDRIEAERKERLKQRQKDMEIAAESIKDNARLREIAAEFKSICEKHGVKFDG
jgi:hypothetical protein